jgi:hypothetical protein
VEGRGGWAALLRSRMADSGRLSRCVVVLLVCRCRGLVSPGFRFPPDVIMIAVRWYLRYGLMPLWMSSRGGRLVSVLRFGLEELVDLTGDVAF